MTNRRLPPWAVLVCLLAICAAVIGGVALLRARSATTATLLSRLPSDDAVIVSVDFRALRDTGILGLLSGSRVMQDAEYRVFVDQTGFDYLNDLDSVLISFHSTGTYLLLRGRFDWKALRDYVQRQGGHCYNTLCRMGGSTPQRKISFFPLQSGTMALAVSEDDSAALMMHTRGAQRPQLIPEDPVWALIPVARFRNSASAPAGTRAFARALSAADSVTLAAAPQGGQLALRMDASCRTQADAHKLATELRDATARLRDFIARENQTPSTRDLSGVLAAGAFDQAGTHVIGRWPISRDLLENVAGGSL